MGLVASRIEAEGVSTVCLSNIPDLTVAVGVPRVVGLEYPFGRTLGEPGDSSGQLAILRATLQAVAGMGRPGSVVHLPFKWRDSGSRERSHPPEPPPIARYLMKHPWHLPRLVARKPPR